ncbi:hypothetical protein CAEBREN_18427 [Caenorhabditis brenneri]|uniref:Uncharacterized protein n=1 Tax=Caenorhabditis brenneri TaxID=135651 RepID=G0NBH6_CAEBE|nr:hypothetical protein CAEBREN_18427 [Caenorhabditis brenneri]
MEDKLKENVESSISVEPDVTTPECQIQKSSSNQTPRLLYAVSVQNKSDLLNGIQETVNGATVEKFGFRKQKKISKTHPILDFDALVAGKKKLGAPIVPGAMLSVKYHKTKRNKGGHGEVDTEKSKEESFDSDAEQMAEERMKKKAVDDVRKDDGSKKKVTTSSVEEVASSPKGTGVGGINDPETNGGPFPDMDEQVYLHGTERKRVEEDFTITSTHTLSSTSIHLGDCGGPRPDPDVTCLAGRWEEKPAGELVDMGNVKSLEEHKPKVVAQFRWKGHRLRSKRNGRKRKMWSKWKNGKWIIKARRMRRRKSEGAIVGAVVTAKEDFQRVEEDKSSQLSTKTSEPPRNSLAGSTTAVVAPSAAISSGKGVSNDSDNKKTGGPGESGEQTNSMKETVDIEDTSESEEEEMDLCTKWNRRKTKQWVWRLLPGRTDHFMEVGLVWNHGNSIRIVSMHINDTMDFLEYEIDHRPITVQKSGLDYEKQLDSEEPGLEVEDDGRNVSEDIPVGVVGSHNSTLHSVEQASRNEEILPTLETLKPAPLSQTLHSPYIQNPVSPVLSSSTFSEDNSSEEVSESEGEKLDFVGKWNCKKMRKWCRKYETPSGVPCNLLPPSASLEKLPETKLNKCLVSLQIHQDLGVRMDDRQRFILENSRNIKIHLSTNSFVESWKPVEAEAGPTNGYSLLDDSDAMDFSMASSTCSKIHDDIFNTIKQIKESSKINSPTTSAPGQQKNLASISCDQVGKHNDGSPKKSTIK